MELAEAERRLKPSNRRTHELALRLVRDEYENQHEFDKLYQDSVVKKGKQIPLIKKRQKKRKGKPNNASSEERETEESPFLTKEQKKLAKIEQRKRTKHIFDIVCLEQADVTELDLRPHLKLICDQVLWELGDLCPRVTSMNLSGWPKISVSGLRSVALGFGERLRVLDISHCPVSDEMVKMLTARFFVLDTLLFKHCVQLSNASLKAVSEGSSGTLKTLDVSHCPKISEDGLFWLAGTSGAAALPCQALESLSVERCVKVRDAGLVALGKGCRNLKYLNVSWCNQLTSKGIIGLAQGCHQLQILHMPGCIRITDPALYALGENCHSLRSINLASCGQITDAGLQALCQGTKSLHALNVAGCIEISELGIFYIVNRTKALQVLNVTGCELVTRRGLQEMLRGLEFVELAHTYTGFKPKKNLASLKLKAQLQLVKDNASRIISAVIRAHGVRIKLRRDKMLRARNDAAHKIQCWIRGRFGKAVYIRMYIRKRKEEAAIVMQRAFRARLCRLILKLRRHKKEQDERNAIFAIKLQAAYRGKQTRKAHPEVVEAILQMKEERWVEAMSAAVVRLQAIVRNKISITLHAAKREELAQRVKDINFACIKIQAMVRGKLCVWFVARKRQKFRRRYARELAAATEIQKIVRGMIGKRILKDKIAERERHRLLMIEMAKRIQRIYRGRLGRNNFLRQLALHKRRIAAAIVVQKYARNFLVPHWRSIKFEMVKQAVKEQDMETYYAAEMAVRKRVNLRVAGLARDSASEDEMIRSLGGYGEESDDDDWQEHFDEQLQRVFYFSPSRNIRTFDKYENDNFEKVLVEKYVKVLDLELNQWRQAVVTKFNHKKRKHRVDYYDDYGEFNGDHEWIYFKENESRIQVYDEECETWGMLRHLRVAFINLQKAIEAEREILDPELFNRGQVTSTEEEGNYTTGEEQQEWEQLYDAETGLHYYHNHATGETTWELPG